MAGKLEGKVAVITGAGSLRGCGKEIALAMAIEGARVVVNDIYRNTDGSLGADAVVEQIVKAKGIAVANHDSVATMTGAQHIIDTAINKFGKIDILVNTAGNYVKSTILEMTEEQWDSVIAVHLKGAFNCTKAASRYMAEQKSGRIINFSSRGAFFGENPVYAAAKAGVMGFTRALSMELSEYNITVNAILPSAVTELFPGAKPKHNADNMPTYEKKGAEYVAPIVVFLATDKAKDITGRFFWAGGGDILMYSLPFKMSAANIFIRKSGKWTIDELDETIPSMLGVI